mgnify:CR=1 FL=1
MRQPLSTPSQLRESALRTLQIEQAAIGGLQAKLDESFDHACQLMLACQGRVVVTGMGKSGHIAGKIVQYVKPNRKDARKMGMMSILRYLLLTQ